MSMFGNKGNIFGGGNTGGGTPLPNKDVVEKLDKDKDNNLTYDGDKVITEKTPIVESNLDDTVKEQLVPKDKQDKIDEIVDNVRIENGKMEYFDGNEWKQTGSDEIRVNNGKLEYFDGNEWVQGGNGNGDIKFDGGISVKGELNDESELPTEGEIGDSYLIDNELHVWVGDKWSNVGQIGVNGKSAYELAVQEGFTGTLSQWLASLKGKDGTGSSIDLPLPANDVAESSTKRFIHPDKIAQIDANVSDINSHLQRIISVENQLGSLNTTSTDEKVKMDSTGDAKYLSELIDDITIKSVNGKLVAKSLDGMTATIGELNRLGGLTGNIQTQLNQLSNDITTGLSNVQSDNKVKASSTDNSAGYLSDKVDSVTVQVVNNKLIVKNIDGLTIGLANINTWLNGTEGNIQAQINNVKEIVKNVSSGMTYLGTVETHADLSSVTNIVNGALIVVKADESLTGGRSMYVYSEDNSQFEFIGEFTFSDKFIDLTDTPASYTGHNGKVLTVDATNNKIVFSELDWSAIKNKPASTVADIQDAVTKRHSHTNKSVLDKFSEDSSGNPQYNNKAIGMNWETFNF